MKRVVFVIAGLIVLFLGGIRLAGAVIVATGLLVLALGL